MELRGKKADNGLRVGFSQSQKVDLSMHSQGIVDNDQDGSQKFFSFNQSFTNIEHNNKLIQEKTNSLHKIKNLEDQIKSYKARSDLWQKTKTQILALNQSLKLSAISLGCSDSAIMREFFDTVGKLVHQKEGKDKEQKTQLAEAARQNAQLFEKLVESKKQRYQLEQQLVNIRHQNSKLSDMNTTLREKSRAHSTERSSKIKEFHEETILTIHQKELELTQLEQRNEELVHSIKQLQAQINSLHQQLDKRQDELLEKMQSESGLIKRCEQLKKELVKEREERGQLEHCKQQQKETEQQIAEIKDYLKSIVEENITIRTELARRAEIITELRRIIQDARMVNQQCIAQQAQIAEQQKDRQKLKITELIKAEQALKKNLKANLRFGINSPNSYRQRKCQKSKSSLRLLPSSEELLI